MHHTDRNVHAAGFTCGHRSEVMNAANRWNAIPMLLTVLALVAVLVLIR